MSTACDKLYESKKLGYFEIIDYEFSKNFVEYIRNYNELDKNIGITISLLVNFNDPKLAYPMIKKLTTHDKMAVLKELITKKFNETNSLLVKEFCGWIKKASTTRTERNELIHGCWSLAGSVTETPVIFSPINWDIEAKSDNKKFSLEEFKIIVEELKDVCSEFGNLRRKYPLF